MPEFQLTVTASPKNSQMCGNCQFCQVGSIIPLNGPMKGVRSRHCGIYGGKMLSQTRTGQPRRCKECRKAEKEAIKLGHWSEDYGGKYKGPE